MREKLNCKHFCNEFAQMTRNLVEPSSVIKLISYKNGFQFYEMIIIISNDVALVESIKKNINNNNNN